MCLCQGARAAVSSKLVKMHALCSTRQTTCCWRMIRICYQQAPYRLCSQQHMSDSYQHPASASLRTAVRELTLRMKL